MSSTIHPMTTDRTTAGHRIVAAGKKTGIKVDQVGVGTAVCPPGNRHPVGIMTEGTGHPKTLNMLPMTGKVGLEAVKKNIGVVAAETEAVIAFGIGDRVTVLFITGQEQVRIVGTMDTIGTSTSSLAALVAVMTITAIDAAGGIIFRAQAGHAGIFADCGHRVIAGVSRIKAQSFIDFLHLPGNSNGGRK